MFLGTRIAVSGRMRGITIRGATLLPPESNGDASCTRRKSDTNLDDDDGGSREAWGQGGIEAKG